MREVAYIERNHAGTLPGACKRLSMQILNQIFTQKVWIQGQCECQRRGSGSWVSQKMETDGYS